MDIQQGLVRTRCWKFAWIQECISLLLDSCMVFLIYKRELLYMIFIRSIQVENFNVSNTKDNAHTKLSRYV